MTKFRAAVAVLAFSAAGAVGLALDEYYTSEAIIPVPGDVPTLGFGSTKGVRMGDTTTPPKALRRFISEIKTDYEGPLKKCLTGQLSQSEYDTLVKESYNAGAGAICREIAPKFNAAKTEEDYAAACDSFIGWRETVKGKSCRVRANDCYGLVVRRKAASESCKKS
ncbi:glycoside hydrolase family protein [Nitrosovibrio sp. Nv4]|uniref:glycoside hydrolase family protein n=1 Tax=Nitrosovibrio sp. Nv4 TaxID=1945880 RepID=UPI000BCFA578|nr:glycoside hydrolase family 24 [Nitrosovibrio sp. Nv4]SOD41307.1 lysozyme [Nitrosovibrio sp. Nv4]